MGFGSVGTAMMTGTASGLATRPRRSKPCIVAIHCVAHRLALACSRASENHTYKIQASIKDTLVVFSGQCSTKSTKRTRTLPAVLTALARERAENGKPAAIRVMKCYEFVTCLNLMYKVLPHLSRLSCLFLVKNVQLSTIKAYLNACTKALESYKKWAIKSTRC